MKQFDHKFKQQVEKAFDNYNADHLADAGWNAFEGRQKSSTRFAIILPLWVKAASIAILLTVGGFLTFNALKSSDNKSIAEVDKTQNPQSITNYNLEKINNGQVSTDELASLSYPAIAKAEANTSKSTSKKENDDNIDLPIKIIQNEELDSSTIAISNVSFESDAIAVVLNAESDQSTQVNDEELEQTNILDLQKTPTITNPSVYQLSFIEEPAKATKNRKTSYMAGLSGMVAHVENFVSDAPGVSVGLYAERKLADNIAIRPGLAIARHSYGLQSLSNSQLAFDATDPNHNGYDGRIVSTENHMDIVAMELPINFVLTILERRKSSLFLSAGTSSMIYLNQRFTGTVNSRYVSQHFDTATGLMYYDSSVSTTQEETEYSAFSRIDLFGLANLSAGYIIPFGKNSNMLIEPFIQLPMGNITSNNLRIRYGGLSIKFEFGK